MAEVVKVRALLFYYCMSSYNAEDGQMRQCRNSGQYKNLVEMYYANVLCS